MSDAAASSKPSGPVKKERSPEFNPRWKGYVFIALTSLVNFASISSISSGDRNSFSGGTIAFGLVTFSLAVLVLIQDRSQRCLETFHFTKSKDGYFEGVALVCCVLWWCVGTGCITHAGGIAYVANNIYFSSWVALFSCVYTLNEWSASKDILSISELTGLSETLKSWWVVCLGSMVVLGTCIDLQVRLAADEIDDTSVGIAMSVTSLAISIMFISVHYDFLPQCEEGGWAELSSSFFLILLWTIALAIMTQDQGIAATIGGTRCSREDVSLGSENCTIVAYSQVGFDENGNAIFEQVSIDCGDIPRQVPGSNLYLATWTCFFASLNISFRWKAQQALQFAQAQQEKQQQRQLATASTSSSTKGSGEESGKGADDDDDDDDDEL